MNKGDIIALIEGRLTNEKKEAVVDWLLKNPKEQEYYQILKAQYIAESLSDSDNIFSKSKSINKKNWSILKYASIVVLLLASSFLFWKQLHEVEDDIDSSSIILTTTSIGENKEVILSDGTTVMLNANSILSYPSQFSGRTRSVVLNGEAFFEVTENKNKPFIVNTDNDIKIKVLGTSFNVKSYPDDENVEAILVSGKVRVIESKDNKEVVLKPSQRATYSKKDDKLSIDIVKTDNFTSWKRGVMVYDETPMSQVISDLKRAYNITIKIKSSSIKSYKYTGVFDNLTIEEVLDLFEISSPITYKLNNKEIILDMNK